MKKYINIEDKYRQKNRCTWTSGHAKDVVYMFLREEMYRLSKDITITCEDLGKLNVSFSMSYLSITYQIYSILTEASHIADKVVH